MLTQSVTQKVSALRSKPVRRTRSERVSTLFDKAKESLRVGQKWRTIDGGSLTITHLSTAGAGHNLAWKDRLGNPGGGTVEEFFQMVTMQLPVGE